MNDLPLPDDLQAMAAGYVLGDLSSEEMAQFQELLIVHPELEQLVTSLQETLLLLPYGQPPQHPSSHVRAQLWQRAQGETQTVLSLPVLRPKPKQRRLPRASHIAASVVILLGGVSLWLTHRVTTLQAQLALAESLVERAISEKSSPTLTVSPADALLNQQWLGLAQLMQDHEQSLGRSQGPVDVAATDVNALSSQLAIAGQLPTLASPIAKLLGGSRCQFGQAQGIRLTYRLPTEEIVSVYQIDLQGNQFPELAETYVTLNQPTANLVLWREENHLYALTAELSIADLQTLAETLELI